VAKAAKTSGLTFCFQQVHVLGLAAFGLNALLITGNVTKMPKA